MSVAPIKLLLVEDNEDDFCLTQRLLFQGGGPDFLLERATTLRAALERIRTKETDVILLDLALPDSRGWATFSALRAQASASHVALILLTGLDDSALGLRAVQEGAEDYLIKGKVTAEHLIRAIRYAIERRRSTETLKKYRDHLEELVSERTAELQASNERLHREVAVRTQTEDILKETIAKLEESDRAKTQFVSNVSHELRTPLTSMRNAVENLLRGVVGPLPDRARDYMQMFRDDCQRLAGTVNDILDLSRLETGTLFLTHMCVPIARLVNRGVSSVRRRAEEKGLTLTLRADDAVGFINGDPERVEKIIRSILDNAIRFTGPGGAIEVSVTPANGAGNLAIDILDTGIGIAPEHLPHLTERYFRIGKHVTGTGLGLTMAKEILTLHRGQLSIKSPPPGRPKGTQVSILMPAVSAPSVLLAVPDAAILDLLRSQLSTHGYRTITSDSPDETLTRMQENMLQIAFVSPALAPKGLPTPQGAEAPPYSGHVPIILVTDGDAAAGRRLPWAGVPVLSPPWRCEDIPDRIEDSILGSRQPESGRIGGRQR